LVTNASNCSASGFGILTATVPPTEAIATASSYFTQGQIISVAVSPPGDYQYQMDNGPFQSSNEFINMMTGWHDILVKNDCGFKTTRIRIIDYPHFFTPNGDGYNDSWNIWDLSDQPSSVIYIFDRYGKLLKQLSPLGTGWDGTFNGKTLPSTDYWFKVFYTELGTDRIFKSHFSLKR
jgi:gliding motility-associated-like protein